MHEVDAASETGEQGRGKKMRVLTVVIAVALAEVSALEDKFNGICEPPPPAVPPPWKPEQRWTRRSAFRGRKR